MDPATSSPERLRIAGAWSGALDLDLSSWTLPMLRAEIARRTGPAVSPDCINLICGGKVLRDGDGAGAKSLAEIGLKNNSKVLASAVATADRGKALNNEADRAERLSRLRAAALAVAGRHAGGLLPEEDFNMELENQKGEKVEFGSETDKRGLMMGIMLHTNAKSLIKKQQYKDALDVLAMAEEAFSLCDTKVTEMIDNLPILELDTVWCYFMLRDISCLSVAGMRLVKARKGFERAYGKDSSRFRLLQEGRQAELSLYLRLELLEGVVAFHSGNLEESRKALSSAQARYMQLQVPDEALSMLMSMGYKERASKRALRMTGQDIPSAVEFLVEERAKKARRHEEDLKRQSEIMEQKRYGKTPLKKAVDLENLKALVSTGYEKDLAAEALRVNENDIFQAIDDLSNSEKRAKLENKIILKELVASGYDRSEALHAVNAASHMQGEASNLVPQQQVGPSVDNAAVDQEEEEQDVEMEEERDEEMEEELAKELQSDPFEDYDLEVTNEGEAILEYQALLESKTDDSEASR